jgi:hypothetical protein
MGSCGTGLKKYRNFKVASQARMEIIIACVGCCVSRGERNRNTGKVEDDDDCGGEQIF